MTDAAPSRDELRRHLVASRIAGDIATPRASNVGNVTKMLDREWDYWFGVELDRPWTAAEVVDLMARRTGIDADLTRTTGADVIDPDRTLDALDAAADLLAEAAAVRARVFLATGHPTGILAIHLAVAAALRAAGATVVTPAAEDVVETRQSALRTRIRYLGGVAMLATGGDFLHTHAAEPMQHLLRVAHPGRPLADLVVADHGWAGAAAQGGLPTIGFADSNDPALFVAAEQGQLPVVVPLDDNVPPADYEPVAAYLLRHLRST